MTIPTAGPKSKSKAEALHAKKGKTSVKRAAFDEEDEKEEAEEAGSGEKLRPKLKMKPKSAGQKFGKGLSMGDDDNDLSEDDSAFAKQSTKKPLGLKRTKTRPEVVESIYGSNPPKRRRISEAEEDVEEEEKAEEDVHPVQEGQKKKKRGRPAKKAKPTQDED